MTKLKTSLIALSIITAPLAVGATASATNSGSISNTGNGSNNQVVNNESYTCTVENNNNIVVRDENNQVAGTGTANSSNNQSGGNATTGNASNSNGSNFTVEITNSGCDVTEASVPVTPTEETPEERDNQGQGAVSAPVSDKPSVLAETSGTDLTLVAAILATIGLSTFGAFRFATYLRR